MLYPHVIEQHAEMLPFLWTQRTELAQTESTTITDLNRFDLRLKGNQDGLVLAGKEAWPILERVWTRSDRGTLFARASLALAFRELEAFAALASLPCARSPLVSALGFAPSGDAGDALGFLAARGDPPLRQIASRGHRALRLTKSLAPLIADSDPSVHRPAIEAAGLARQVDDATLCALHEALRAGGFGPLWALWLISQDSKYLDPMLEAPDVDIGRAVLAARLAPRSWLSSWIAANRDRSCALAIALTAALGLGDHLGWLGEALEDAEYGAQAAQAIRHITGAPDLAVEPEPAEAVTPPATARALRAWIEANAERFTGDERYLLGVPISPKSVFEQLCHGTQGLRVHAAFELASANTAAPIINTRSPAFRQLFSLRLLRTISDTNSWDSREVAAG